MGWLDWMRQVFVGEEKKPAATPAEPVVDVKAGPVKKSPRAPDASGVELGFETPPTRPKRATVVARNPRQVQPIKRNKKANKTRNTRAPGFGGPESVYQERPVPSAPEPPRSVPPRSVPPRSVPPRSVPPAAKAEVSPDAPTDVRTPIAERETDIREVVSPDATTAPRGALSPRPSRRLQERDTLAWVLVPKLEALLRQVDDALASPSTDRPALIGARNRFERDWTALSPVPPDQAERLLEAYAERQQQLAQRIAALPDPGAEEEARHLAERAALVVEAEQLANWGAPTFDLHAAVARAKVLQRQWRDAGRVSREALSEFGPRFKAAIDAVFARREDDRAGKVHQLQGFVDQAEVLARSKDPAKAAEAMKQLQARWKSIGGVRGEDGDALWTRFRAAADQVFARRKAAYEDVAAGSVAAREALIAQASALAEEGVEDPDEAIRQLQGKWRRLAPAPREQADALWTRFKASLDRLRSPPPVDAAALGEGGALRFSPFATLVPGPDALDPGPPDEAGS